MKKKSMIGFFGFIVGFTGNLLGLMGPIHEIFHYVFLRLEGQSATIYFGTTAFAHPSLLPALAGPFGEAFVLYILSFILLFRGRLGAALFFLGTVHAAFLLGFVSSDFNIWVAYLVGHGGLVLTLIVWTVFNGLMLSLGWMGVAGVASKQ